MTELAVDYAWAHPAPDAIKRAGVAGVLRYLSHDPSKDLTTLEASLLRAAGLWVAVVWETSQTRANVGGEAGGIEDARDANVAADEIGYPKDAPIFYACDTTPNLPAVMDYFRGIASVPTTRPRGWYGGMQAGLSLKALGRVSLVWVANAASWSGFRHFDELEPVALANPNVAMLQSTARTLPGLDPNSYDLDEIVHPFTAWGTHVVPAPPAKPIPPVVLPKDGEMEFVRVTTLPLDEHGNGYVDVPGVNGAQFRGATVVGLHDPNGNPKGFTRIPRVAGDEIAKPCRVVVEDGEPGGRYVILVQHV